jgi:hypothetical protein
MTVITDPTTAAQFDLRAVARLSLAPTGRSPGPLDGAWWPYSHDLTLELPPLTAAFENRWGRITRAAVNPALWPVIPRKVQVTGRVVRVGRFTVQQDPHALLLLSRKAGRWDLLVIPPQTSPATAARLMAAASDPRNVLTASELMAGPAARVTAEADSVQEADWESEGGRGVTVPTVSPRERRLTMRLPRGT